jgi:putative Ca2+/H+ antiporter (TMEM165/GDT1 family)
VALPQESEIAPVTSTTRERNCEMLYLFVATYGTIFVSELIGDKNIYTISSLAMRFPAFQVLCGFTAAFAVKAATAVLLGQVISELPASLVTVVSTATFFLTALIIWFKRSGDAPVEPQHKTHFSKAVLIAFAAILFSEWGDVGQIMAANLTARYHAPLLVWIGTTLALITKGVLAMAIGFGLRRRVPLHILRPVSAILCLILGLISAADSILASHAPRP